MAKASILPGQVRLITAISAVHVIAWFAYLSQIPLGQYLSPGEQSTLETALSLAQGNAPDDVSFTLYEFGLSLMARFAGSADALLFLARALNTLALVAATGLCAIAAGSYWKKNRAVWLAGFLTGLNPILVFWSAEQSPALLTVLCATIIFTRLLQWLRKPSCGASMTIGLLLALACALETSLIFFAIAWPFVALAYPNRNKPQHLIGAIVGPAAAFLLLIVSSIQLQDPIGMHVGNLGKGIYEIFNSHEAYDGKSYSLHNQVNYFLFVNPIHWGIILILAIAGCYVRLKDGFKGNSTLALAAVLAVFAVSYALNEAGSQTRAALYPILAIYAGGAVNMPRIWKHAGKRTKRRMAMGLLALAGLTYSDFYGSRSHVNWESDYAFLAEANLNLEQNQGAQEWATKALEINPARDDMRSIIVRAVFNEWALSPSPTLLPTETAQLYLEATKRGSKNDATTRVIEAIYYFKLRNTEEARRIWEEYRNRSAMAFICLYWTGAITDPRSVPLETYRDDPYYDLAMRAVRINRNSTAYSESERLIDNILANAY